MKLLKSGDEVAVLPHNAAPPYEVLDIATVVYAGPNLIEVADGRIFFAKDGSSLHGAQDGYIVPATEEHRSVFERKSAVICRLDIFTSTIRFFENN